MASIRQAVVLSLFIALTSCGGGGGSVAPNPPPPPPPPPAPPGPPASIASSSGDGQTGEPGVAVTTKPAVVVRDASSRGVPGVSVTFAVDSGGGSIAGATAITGQDGVATAGNWTLGGTEGRNTLLATTAGLPAVKLAATGLIAKTTLATTTIPVSGGSIAITRPGTPINGLQIDVPAGAFASPVQFDVSYSSSLTLPHVPEVTVGSPIVTIAFNSTASAQELFTVKIPATIASDEVPIVAMVDPVTGFLDALSTVSFDGTSVTAIGALLDEAQLPEATLGSFLRGGGQASATSPQVQLAVLIAKLNVLHNLQLDTGFRPGVDDWEFPTDGSPVFSNSAAGQVVAARFYYRNRKSQTSGSLWQQLQQAKGAMGSDEAGYQWTAGLAKQFDQLVKPFFGPAIAAYTKNLQLANRNALHTVLMSMLASRGAPQIVGFVDELTTPHVYKVVLVYRWDGPNGFLYHANPDLPGDLTEKTVWSSAGRTCLSQCVPVIGLNHLISYQKQLNAEWPQVTSATINRSLFPRIFAPSHSPVIGPGSNTAVDTVFMVDDTTRIWIECPTCVGAYPTTLPLQHGASGIQSQRIYTETSPGQWVKYNAAQTTNGFGIDLAQFPAPSANHWADFLIGIEARALMSTNNGAGAKTGWAGWKVYRVIKYNPLLTFAQAGSGGPVTVTLSSQGGPLLPVGLTYVFKWNDGTANSVFTARPVTAQHTFAGAGPYDVELEIRHPSGNVVVGKKVATFSAIPVWRATTFGSNISAFGMMPQPGPSFPNEPPIDNRDHITWWVADSTLAADIVAHPAHALLVLIQSPFLASGKTIQSGLYLQYDPTGVPGAPGAFDPNAKLIPVAQFPGTLVTPVVPPNQVLEHWDNGLTVTPTTVSGGVIAQVKDFTGLPGTLVGAQQKRTLVAWDVNAAINTTPNPNTLSGTINRYQSLWVYLPRSAARGMYWYNIVTYALTFSAVRVN